MSPAILIASAALAFLATAVAVRAAIGFARSRLLDTPNARSSHSAPVPRGGGIGFVPVILLGWLALWSVGAGSGGPAVLAGAALLAAVSVLDDFGHVRAAVRLAVQAAAVALGLSALPEGATIFAGLLPVPADRLVAGIAWLWFVNLFNFMDGIDGLAAGEAAMVAAGILVLALAAPALSWLSADAAVVLGAALGFLVFNWPPARIFMGDVGSATLGFLLGWLLIAAAASGALASAIILPLYFELDATATLLGRILRRENIAAAHRLHAYQRAVDRGLTHKRVAGTVLILDAALAGLAVSALHRPVISLAAAVLLAAGVYAHLLGLRGARFRAQRP
ncbi:glycosyl transferase [Propylenella binzhouense]|uniref:glycosyl transferase n=1 Tax=Propylenella binzhouense TaxID=2555902 RepID=UPI00136F71BA|nr:glycosyl transferase [Propylenella binzhouense]